MTLENQKNEIYFPPIGIVFRVGNNYYKLPVEKLLNGQFKRHKKAHKKCTIKYYVHEKTTCKEEIAGRDEEKYVQVLYIKKRKMEAAEGCFLLSLLT